MALLLWVTFLTTKKVGDIFMDVSRLHVIKANWFYNNVKNSKLNNCRTYHSAEVGSDHSLAMANITIKISQQPNKIKKTSKAIWCGIFTKNRHIETFEEKVGGRFACLLQDEEVDREHLYNEVKSIIHEVAEQEIGY